MAPPKPSLRLATEGDAPPSPMTITDAASVGTKRDLLVALKTRLARAVEDKDTPPRDLAALSRRLLEVARDIEALDAVDQEASEDGRDSGPTEDETWDEEAI